MLVTDAVLCGTVPIYWGNKNSNINEFFNMDGIIMFETISELENILENVVSEEDYSQRLTAMKDNFNKAKDLNMHDLCTYDQYLSVDILKIFHSCHAICQRNNEYLP